MMNEFERLRLYGRVVTEVIDSLEPVARDLVREHGMSVDDATDQVLAALRTTFGVNQ